MSETTGATAATDNVDELTQQETTTNNEVAKETDAVDVASTIDGDGGVPARIQEIKTTPSKRTPSKRLTAVERAQRESEELIKNMGMSVDVEGGRKTRSSTRGTPSRTATVSTPTPAKKARVSTPRRGRPKKLLDDEPDGDEVKPLGDKGQEVKNGDQKSSEEDKVEKTSDEKNKLEVVIEAETKEEAPAVELPSPVEVAKNEKVTEESSKETKTEELPPVEPMEVDGRKTEETAEAIEEKSQEQEVVDVQNSNSDSTDSSVVCIESESTLPSATVVKSTVVPADEQEVTDKTPVVADNAVEQSKAESNDRCEPKVVSPPPSNSDAVATPQICN